jgi:hypothetical protein
MLSPKRDIPSFEHEAIPTSLVFASEPAPAATAQPSPSAAEAPSHDTSLESGGSEVASAANPGTSTPDRDAMRSSGGTNEQKRIPPRPPAANDGGRKKRQAPDFDVAVYEVLVDTVGNIRDGVLMQSSGVRSFDEAGKKMIYDGMTLPPASHGTSALRVTLHFLHESH